MFLLVLLKKFLRLSVMLTNRETVTAGEKYMCVCVNVCVCVCVILYVYINKIYKYKYININI